MLDYVDKMIGERNKLIEKTKEYIIKGEIKAIEYRKEAMVNFEREKTGLSRIESLYRLNRIEWLCELLNQMEKYFKENNNFDGYTFKMPYEWGTHDERTALDF